MGTMKSISSVWVVTQFCITSLLLLTMLASSRSSRSSTTAQAATGAPSAGPVASSSVAAPPAQNNSTGFCQAFIVSSDYTCSEYMVGGCCFCRWCSKCLSGLQLQLWILDWQQQQQQQQQEVRTRWVMSPQFLCMGVGGDCGWLFACYSTHCSSGGAGNKGTRFLVPWHHGGCYLAIHL